MNTVLEKYHALLEYRREGNRNVYRIFTGPRNLQCLADLRMEIIRSRTNSVPIFFLENMKLSELNNIVVFRDLDIYVGSEAKFEDLQNLITEATLEIWSTL